MKISTQKEHVITQKYTSSDYLSKNELWDQQDSPWKASQIVRLLKDLKLNLNSICDLGCGAGGVLAELRKTFKQTELHGFDIAPDSTRFWPQHFDKNLNLKLGDFTKMESQKFDLVLLLDVLEHLPDPHHFLSEIKCRADFFLIHFPLDLSAINVLREKPLLASRRSVGHIHYFTRNLALELLAECGYEVVFSKYSDAYLNTGKASWKTRLAALPRLFFSLISKDFSARLLGGQTLWVVASAKKNF